MENRKNLCAMIPEALHTQARTEQEQMNRTLAFQISEELFGRIKAHLKATGLSQKDFVIGLIEQALKDAEAKAPQGEGAPEDAQGEPA